MTADGTVTLSDATRTLTRVAVSEGLRVGPTSPEERLQVGDIGRDVKIAFRLIIIRALFFYFYNGFWSSTINMIRFKLN